MNPSALQGYSYQLDPLAISDAFSSFSETIKIEKI
jgi:hypothetical protein